MTTGKTIALTIRTFVGKIMSLLFNTLSRCFTALLPRSSCLLISRLQSLSTVILEPKKTKSVTASLVYPSLCHEAMGQDAMVFVFWMLSFKPAFSLYILHISYKIFGTLFLFTKIFGYICTTYMCMIRPELFMSPVLAGWFFTTSATWQATYIYNVKYIMCQVFCKQNLI